MKVKNEKLEQEGMRGGHRHPLPVSRGTENLRFQLLHPGLSRGAGWFASTRATRVVTVSHAQSRPVTVSHGERLKEGGMGKWSDGVMAQNPNAPLVHSTG